jgi:hypothetical protein
MRHKGGRVSFSIWHKLFKVVAGLGPFLDGVVTFLRGNGALVPEAVPKAVPGFPEGLDTVDQALVKGGRDGGNKRRGPEAFDLGLKAGVFVVRRLGGVNLRKLAELIDLGLKAGVFGL